MRVVFKTGFAVQCCANYVYTALRVFQYQSKQLHTAVHRMFIGSRKSKTGVYTHTRFKCKDYVCTLHTYSVESFAMGLRTFINSCFTSLGASEWRGYRSGGGGRHTS